MIRPSIYEYAGGEPAFLALAAAHHRRCLQDPVLNHPFSHADRNPEHVARLASYWVEVFGGPPRYSESYGGHSAMLGIHAEQGMEPELGDRFVRCFAQAVEDAGLPEDPEFRASLLGYLRWAVDEVFEYGPPGSRVPAELPVPRWSWDGLQSGGPA
ncbi:group II truncated hemoglobin [Plantactinospora sp. DSM 117369]